MFGAIVLHEIRQQIRNKVFWILLPLILAMCLLAAFTHWQQQQSFSQSQRHWQSYNESLWQSQPDRHPHRVAHYGSMVFKPVSPLSFIDAGVGPYVGNALFLEAHRQNSAGIKQFQFSAGNLRLGYPTLATLLLAVWPLILIALACNTFSGEREQGTLRMTLALGVKWRTLFAGKVAAYGLLSFVLLLILFGAVALLLLISKAGSDAWWRLPALFGLYLAYCGLWTGGLVTVSSLCRNHQQSLWLLFSLWLLLVILIPRAIPTLTQMFYPIPDRASFEVATAQALAKLGDSHNPNDPHFAQFRGQILQQYKVDAVEKLPVNWRGLLMTEGERLTSEAFQALHGDLHQQIAQQDKLRNRLAWLSPYALTALLSARLAGTDAADFYAFEAQAEKFRYEMIQKLNHHHTHQIDFENDRAQKLGSAAWRDFSGFEFRALQLTQSLKNQHLLFVGLMVWLAATLTLGAGGKLREGAL